MKLTYAWSLINYSVIGDTYNEKTLSVVTSGPPVSNVYKDGELLADEPAMNLEYIRVDKTRYQDTTNETVVSFSASTIAAGVNYAMVTIGGTTFRVDMFTTTKAYNNGITAVGETPPEVLAYVNENNDNNETITVEIEFPEPEIKPLFVIFKTKIYNLGDYTVTNYDYTSSDLLVLTSDIPTDKYLKLDNSDGSGGFGAFDSSDAISGYIPSRFISSLYRQVDTSATALTASFVDVNDSTLIVKTTGTNNPLYTGSVNGGYILRDANWPDTGEVFRFDKEYTFKENEQGKLLTHSILKTPNGAVIFFPVNAAYYVNGTLSLRVGFSDKRVDYILGSDQDYTTQAAVIALLIRDAEQSEYLLDTNNNLLLVDIIWPESETLTGYVAIPTAIDSTKDGGLIITKGEKTKPYPYDDMRLDVDNKTLTSVKHYYDGTNVFLDTDVFSMNTSQGIPVRGVVSNSGRSLAYNFNNVLDGSKPFAFEIGNVTQNGPVPSPIPVDAWFRHDYIFTLASSGADNKPIYSKTKGAIEILTTPPSHPVTGFGPDGDSFTSDLMTPRGFGLSGNGKRIYVEFPLSLAAWRGLDISFYVNGLGPFTSEINYVPYSGANVRVYLSEEDSAIIGIPNVGDSVGLNVLWPTERRKFDYVGNVYDNNDSGIYFNGYHPITSWRTSYAKLIIKSEEPFPEGISGATYGLMMEANANGALEGYYPTVAYTDEGKTVTFTSQYPDLGNTLLTQAFALRIEGLWKRYQGEITVKLDETSWYDPDFNQGSKSHPNPKFFFKSTTGGGVWFDNPDKMGDDDFVTVTKVNILPGQFRVVLSTNAAIFGNFAANIWLNGFLVPVQGTFNAADMTYFLNVYSRPETIMEEIYWSIKDAGNVVVIDVEWPTKEPLFNHGLFYNGSKSSWITFGDAPVINNVDFYGNSWYIQPSIQPDGREIESIFVESKKDEGTASWINTGTSTRVYTDGRAGGEYVSTFGCGALKVNLEPLADTSLTPVTITRELATYGEYPDISETGINLGDSHSNLGTAYLGYTQIIFANNPKGVSFESQYRLVDSSGRLVHPTEATVAHADDCKVTNYNVDTDEVVSIEVLPIVEVGEQSVKRYVISDWKKVGNVTLSANVLSVTAIGADGDLAKVYVSDKRYTGYSSQYGTGTFRYDTNLPALTLTCLEVDYDTSEAVFASNNVDLLEWIKTSELSGGKGFDFEYDFKLNQHSTAFTIGTDGTRYGWCNELPPTVDTPAIPAFGEYLAHELERVIGGSDLAQSDTAYNVIGLYGVLGAETKTIVVQLSLTCLNFIGSDIFISTIDNESWYKSTVEHNGGQLLATFEVPVIYDALMAATDLFLANIRLGKSKFDLSAMIVDNAYNAELVDGGGVVYRSLFTNPVNVNNPINMQSYFRKERRSELIENVEIILPGETDEGMIRYTSITSSQGNDEQLVIPFSTLPIALPPPLSVKSIERGKVEGVLTNEWSNFLTTLTNGSAGAVLSLSHEVTPWYPDNEYKVTVGKQDYAYGYVDGVFGSINNNLITLPFEYVSTADPLVKLPPITILEIKGTDDRDGPLTQITFDNTALPYQGVELSFQIDGTTLEPIVIEGNYYDSLVFKGDPSGRRLSGFFENDTYSFDVSTDIMPRFSYFLSTVDGVDTTYVSSTVAARTVDSAKWNSNVLTLSLNGNIPETGLLRVTMPVATDGTVKTYTKVVDPDTVSVDIYSTEGKAIFNINNAINLNIDYLKEYDNAILPKSMTDESSNLVVGYSPDIEGSDLKDTSTLITGKWDLMSTIKSFIMNSTGFTVIKFDTAAVEVVGGRISLAISLPGGADVVETGKVSGVTGEDYLTCSVIFDADTYNRLMNATDWVPFDIKVSQLNSPNQPVVLHGSDSDILFDDTQGQFKVDKQLLDHPAVGISKIEAVGATVQVTNNDWVEGSYITIEYVDVVNGLATDSKFEGFVNPNHVLEIDDETVVAQMKGSHAQAMTFFLNVAVIDLNAYNLVTVGETSNGDWGWNSTDGDINRSDVFEVTNRFNAEGKLRMTSFIFNTETTSLVITFEETAIEHVGNAVRVASATGDMTGVVTLNGIIPTVSFTGPNLGQALKPSVGFLVGFDVYVELVNEAVIGNTLIKPEVTSGDVVVVGNPAETNYLIDDYFESSNVAVETITVKSGTNEVTIIIKE